MLHLKKVGMNLEKIPNCACDIAHFPSTQPSIRTQKEAVQLCPGKVKIFINEKMVAGKGDTKRGAAARERRPMDTYMPRPIERYEQDCVRHSLHGISASRSRQMRRSSFPISLKNGLPPSSNSSRYRPETSITTYSTIISSQLTVPFPWRRSQTPLWISTANSSYLPVGNAGRDCRRRRFRTPFL